MRQMHEGSIDARIERIRSVAKKFGRMGDACLSGSKLHPTLNYSINNLTHYLGEKKITFDRHSGAMAVVSAVNSMAA
jgi:hypothetical protein